MNRQTPRSLCSEHLFPCTPRVLSIGPAVPAQPRGDVIDRPRDDHHQPLAASEGAVYPLVVDRLALFIKRIERPLRPWRAWFWTGRVDRKSTRLNSSH